MKRVIRRGVFETNSSSTHALALVKEGEKCKIDNSFEICSPTAKVFMVFGLIENADCDSDIGYRGKERKTMLRFKEALVTALADIEGVTREQALEKIECEAFGNTELKSALGNEEALRIYLSKENRFAAEYKASKNKDIVAFANEYFDEDFKTTKQLMNGKYRCDAYFCNGCLIECDCGFETYWRMVSKFEIDASFTDSELYLRAKEILSDKYKFVCEEYNAGVIFMCPGDKY